MKTKNKCLPSGSVLILLVFTTLICTLSASSVLAGSVEDVDMPSKDTSLGPSSGNPGTPQLGDTWTEPLTGMEFVWVPGGCFQMGSDSSNFNEMPVHEVCVDGFWMARHEVTQAQWKKIMGNNPSHFRGDRRPVEKVSWHDAKSFIKKLNQRSGRTFALPTEAQWEYAAQSGGKNEIYSGGDDVNRVAWYWDNSGNRTHDVGTKARAFKILCQ